MNFLNKKNRYPIKFHKIFSYIYFILFPLNCIWSSYYLYKFCVCGANTTDFIYFVFMSIFSIFCLTWGKKNVKKYKIAKEINIIIDELEEIEAKISPERELTQKEKEIVGIYLVNYVRKINEYFKL